MEFKERFEEAKLIVAQSAEYLATIPRPVPFTLKADNTKVTEHDPYIEEMVKNHLLSKFDDGFAGEETQKIPSPNGLQWILDPIDGTSSFIQGNDEVAISLALKNYEEYVLGIVSNPYTKEVFTGIKGEPITYNQVPLVETKREFSINGFVRSDDKKESLQKIIGSGNIKSHHPKIHTIAYSLAKVAQGTFGACILETQGNLGEYDYAAGKFFVESIGGNCIHYEASKTIVAAAKKEWFDYLVSEIPNLKE